MIHCRPAGHIVDSRFFGQGYTTEEARRVFCDLRRMQRWLEVEAALAASQGRLGCIPPSAAGELETTADLRTLDIAAIRSGIRESGHSLMALLDSWREAVGPGAARFIHFGATTQDIQDTAQVLEAKDICAIIERDLSQIIRQVAALARRHQKTVMVGRTHGQQALPTTLGLKMAVWLDELLRHGERLAQCRPRLLTAQLAGGVGTMAALGGRADLLLTDFAGRLGLNEAAAAWHTARDRHVEFGTVQALLAGTLGKIANEICQLARDEINELEEPFHPGKIGSSTMPHKRNPETCEQVVVLARLIKSMAGAGFDTLINEHERDYRAVRLEWVTVTDVSLYLCGALALMKKILAGLEVHEKAIRRNLADSLERLATEAIMFALSEKMDKHEAHRRLYELTMAARDTGRPISELLQESDTLSPCLDMKQLAAIMAPENHIGLAERITGRVCRQAGSFLAAVQPAAAEELVCPLANAGGGCGVDFEGC